MSLYRHDTTMERHLRQLRVDQGKEALVQPIPEALPTPDESPDQDTKGKGKKSTSGASLVRYREDSFDKRLRELHSTSPDDAALYSLELRAKIVEQFQEACQKENVIKRKKVMQKRIQWIITRGGAGSLVQRPEHKEMHHYHAEIKEVHDSHGKSKRVLGKTRDKPMKEKRPNRLRHGLASPKDKDAGAIPEPTSASGSHSPPPLSPDRSYTYSYDSPTTMHSNASEWTEEDEVLFTQQMHAARQLSLQPSLHSSKDSGSFSPDAKEGNLSYEEALLAAAAEWSQETPAIEGTFGSDEGASQSNLEKDLPAVQDGHP